MDVYFMMWYKYIKNLIVYEYVIVNNGCGWIIFYINYYYCEILVCRSVKKMINVFFKENYNLKCS